MGDQAAVMPLWVGGGAEAAARAIHGYLYRWAAGLVDSEGDVVLKMSGMLCVCERERERERERKREREKERKIDRLHACM